VDERLYRNVVGVLIEQVAKEIYLSRPERAFHQRDVRFASAEASASAEIKSLLSTVSSSTVTAARRSMLRELLRLAPSATQFVPAADRAMAEARKCAEQGDTQELVQLLLTLKREGERTDDGSQKAAMHATLEWAASPAIVSRLVKHLPDLEATTQNEVIALLGLLGEGGRAALVELVRRQSRPSSNSEAAVRVMALMGGKAEQALRSLLLSASEPALNGMMKTLSNVPAAPR